MPLLRRAVEVLSAVYGTNHRRSAEAKRDYRVCRAALERFAGGELLAEVD